MRSAFLVLLVLVSSCVYLTDGEGNVAVLGRDDRGHYLEGVESGIQLRASGVMLQAMVKGSIYEAGEMVSVFGTCLDAHDNPLPNMTAYLSSWYPNGTAHIVLQQMEELQPGYYLYMGPMEAVQGTYLTQLTCYEEVLGLSALAFGEWQNPYWVFRLAQLNESVAELAEQVTAFEGNVSMTLADMTIEITNGFAITWDALEQINETMGDYYINLSEQIYQVALVANASVDRNDSYIVQLLMGLLGAVVNGTNQTGQPVNWTETPGPVIYWSDWELRVDVTHPASGKMLTFPDVLCEVWTSQTLVYTPMLPRGNHFIYREFINTMDPFTWVTVCYFA